MTATVYLLPNYSTLYILPLAAIRSRSAKASKLIHLCHISVTQFISTYTNVKQCYISSSSLHFVVCRLYSLAVSCSPISRPTNNQTTVLTLNFILSHWVTRPSSIRSVHAGHHSICTFRCRWGQLRGGPCSPSMALCRLGSLAVVSVVPCGAPLQSLVVPCGI